MRIAAGAGSPTTRPSSQEPYAGVSGSRPLWRVTVSSTRPSRCATLFLADIVAPA